MTDVGPGTAHEAAVMDVLTASRNTGKAAGKHCADAAEEAIQRIEEGFQFLAVASDSRVYGCRRRALRSRRSGIAHGREPTAEPAVSARPRRSPAPAGKLY